MFELSSSVERDCEESFMPVWSLYIVPRHFLLGNINESNPTLRSGPEDVAHIEQTLLSTCV